eukprot:jgi/Mesen1/154/ME1130931C07529
MATMSTVILFSLLLCCTCGSFAELTQGQEIQADETVGSGRLLPRNLNEASSSGSAYQLQYELAGASAVELAIRDLHRHFKPARLGGGANAAGSAKASARSAGTPASSVLRRRLEQLSAVFENNVQANYVEHSVASKQAPLSYPLEGGCLSGRPYAITLLVGKPAKPYPLLIDTGSSLTWLLCSDSA